MLGLGLYMDTLKRKPKRKGEKASRELCKSRQKVRDELLNEIRTNQNSRDIIRTRIID